MPGDRPGGLIVLLGEENSDQGDLTDVAMHRADAALAVAARRPTYKVLPTGGFGDHFNRSDLAHGHLLTRYISSKGLPQNRILPYVNSSRTLDDALMTRIVAVDHHAKSLIVVTSGYHIPRASYLFRRALPDFALTFHSAGNAFDTAERLAGERYKLAREKAGWLDPPLYGLQPQGKAFPADIYKNASDEQKHYDRISYLMVAGQFVMFGFAYTTNVWRFSIPLTPVYIVSSAFIVLMFLMYLRTAAFANTSRELMRAIELQWTPGFSLNVRRRNFSHPLPQWIERIRLPARFRENLLKLAAATNFVLTLGFTTTVAVVTMLMIVVQLVASVLAASGQVAASATPDERPAISPGGQKPTTGSPGPKAVPRNARRPVKAGPSPQQAGPAR